MLGRVRRELPAVDGDGRGRGREGSPRRRRRDCCVVGGGGIRSAAARRGERRPLLGGRVAAAVGGRRCAAVGDAAAPLPKELKPALMGAAEDGELLVAEIGDLKDKLPEGLGVGGIVDDLVGEAGPAKPEARRGRVITSNADDEDSCVLIWQRKGPDPQGNRYLEPEPEWMAASRGTGPGRAWGGRREPERERELGGEREGKLPARGRGPTGQRRCHRYAVAATEDEEGTHSLDKQ